MKRYAFWLPLIAAASLCFACSQALGPSMVAQGSASTPRLCDIGSSIQVLQPGYDPNANPYRAPTDSQNVQQNYQLRAEIVQDLRSAYSAAPADVQGDLCALTGIFIDTTACTNGDVNNCQNSLGQTPISWGFRSHQGNDQGKTYIAISGALWPVGSPNHATVISLYEKTILQALVAPPYTNNGVWSNAGAVLPSISSARPDKPEETVLAALAHELGHVKLATIIHPGNGNGSNYSFSALQPCGAYISDFFLGWTYSKKQDLFPHNMWRQFGHSESDNGGKITEHSNSPYIHDFNNADPSPPANQNANQLLHDLYSGSAQPWASFWASFAPDEDFVETYVLHALQSSLSSLKIRISGFADYDIVAGVAAKQTLQKKLSCVASFSS